MLYGRSCPSHRTMLLLEHCTCSLLTLTLVCVSCWRDVIRYTAEYWSLVALYDCITCCLTMTIVWYFRLWKTSWFAVTLSQQKTGIVAARMKHRMDAILHNVRLSCLRMYYMCRRLIDKQSTVNGMLAGLKETDEDYDLKLQQLTESLSTAEKQLLAKVKDETDKWVTANTVIEYCMLCHIIVSRRVVYVVSCNRYTCMCVD